jgi:GTPase SAR1 family protein
MSSIKIIVMGVGGVGKSAITNRFVIGRWVEKVRADKIVSWFQLIVVLQINLVRSYR